MWVYFYFSELGFGYILMLNLRKGSWGEMISNYVLLRSVIFIGLKLENLR